MDQKEFSPAVDRSAFDALERIGCEIRWFREGDFEIPEEVDLSLFPQDKRESALWAFRVLTNYVRNPAIKDWFEDHSQRRRWLATLPPELTEMIRGNRLRGNNTGVVIETMRLLTELIDDRDPRVSQINAIRDQLRLNYPDSSQNTPLEFADLMAGSALDVLNLFSEDYPKEASG